MKILIKENQVISNEAISIEKQNYSNGKTLLQMLDKLGLTLTSVNDWGAIEREFTKDYPKASLTFNLQANGIESDYRAAEAFYVKNQHRLRFEPLTDEQAEAIREKHRVYASTEKQIEAHGLLSEITDKLNRLIELGVNVDVNKTYLVNRVFEGDPRQKPAIQMNQRSLSELLINLK